MPNFTFIILWFGLVLNTLGQESQEMDVFRLPDTTKPESYDLLIVPTLNGPYDSCYSGDVKIVILPNKCTNTITLNVREVDITQVTISECHGQSAKEIKVVEQIFVSKNEQFIIKLDTSIVPDKKYVLKMKFAASIRSEIDESGLYMRSYVEDKVIKWVLIVKN